MEKEGVDFPNAAHLLASRCGIIIPENKEDGDRWKAGSGSGENALARKRMYLLHEKLAEYYRENLLNNPDSPIAKYVSERGLSADIIKKFQVGAAPDSWDATLQWAGTMGFTEEELLVAGIVIKNDETGRIYDRFRNRVIFPIWDEQARIIAFSARSIEKEVEGAKYVNSPETPVFKKGRILYALPLAREAIRDKKFAIICEGQLDVIAMHRSGLNNALAPQGTAFTDEQARILRRYTECLYLAFDADEAGIKAVIRALDIILPLSFEVKIINLPEGDDPDIIFRRDGAEVIRNLVDNASDFFYFLFNRALAEHDRESPWGKDRIASEILDHISKIESPVVRASYASELAQNLKLPEAAIFSGLNSRRKKEKFRSVEVGSQSALDAQGIPQKAAAKAEELLLELALNHGTAGRHLSEELPSKMISNTSVGNALKKVIALTLDGEWENSSRILASELCENPDPIISRILAQPLVYDEEKQNKSLADCIKMIKKSFLEAERNELMIRWKNAGVHSEDAERLRQEYLEKILELKELRTS